MRSVSYMQFLEQSGYYYEIAKIKRQINWEGNYDKKIYDKLNEKAIKLILMSKVVISENYYQKLKTNKVLLEIFIVLKSLGNIKIKSFDLLEFGFKKTSIKLAIKKLLDLGILNVEIYKKFGILKLRKIVLKKPKERFWILQKKDA